MSGWFHTPSPTRRAIVDRRSGSLVVPVAIALRDDAPHPGDPGSFKQVIGALGPQAIGERELLIEVFVTLPVSAVS
jgi:hypothetical protein